MGALSRTYPVTARQRTKGFLVLFFLLLANSAWAGPPYITDDPEPTPNGTWENYLYISGTNQGGVTSGQAGVQLNYGAAPNLQLSVTVPEDYAVSRGLRGGAGDVGAGAKFRFWQAADGSWLPDMCIYPSGTLPTGARRFSTGHGSLLLPVWLEKDFGPWSSFGGGGYTVNPGGGHRNYVLAGWAVTRDFGERLNLGIEVYHQTASVAKGVGETNLGVGAIYRATRRWAVVASGGPGLEGGSAFFFGLRFAN